MLVNLAFQIPFRLNTSHTNLFLSAPSLFPLCPRHLEFVHCKLGVGTKIPRATSISLLLSFQPGYLSSLRRISASTALFPTSYLFLESGASFFGLASAVLGLTP